jgi:hypothetical protein
MPSLADPEPSVALFSGGAQRLPRDKALEAAVANKYNPT